jgi:hypothetical protein
VHTVELLLDPRLESGVRDLWNRLGDAGFPSLATHSHPTNRPHLTVLTADSLDGLPPLRLPAAAELTDVRILGRALVRQVTLTPELREIQAEAWSALGRPAPEWTPHVSLALRIRDEAALDFLGNVPPERGLFVAARTYDTRTRTVTTLKSQPA